MTIAQAAPCVRLECPILSLVVHACHTFEGVAVKPLKEIIVFSASYQKHTANPPGGMGVAVLCAKLASRERELKQKEGIIDAAAAGETEIGKLIERLSTGCDKLSEELCEKRIRIARLQDKPRRSAMAANCGKKSSNLVQEEALVRVAHTLHTEV